MSNFKNPVISVVTNKLSSALVFDSVGRGRLTVWGNQNTDFSFDITSALKPGALQELMQLVDRGDLSISLGFLGAEGSSEYTYTGALCAVENTALGTPANEQQPSSKAAAGFSGKEMAEFYTSLPGISVKSEAPKVSAPTQVPQGGTPVVADAQEQHDAALSNLNSSQESGKAQEASEESGLDELFDLEGGTSDLIPETTPVATSAKTTKAPAAAKTKSKKVSK